MHSFIQRIVLRSAFLWIVLGTIMPANAQHGIRGKKLLDNDTVVAELKKMQDNPEFQKAYDSIRIRQKSMSEVESIVHELDRNARRQKTGAYIRIGIGVAMLVVLIIGLSRRRKKTP